MNANGPRAPLRGEWFWTDRWVGSSAFLLPVEARGVYREMLTQAWRRGAKLPNDHEAIRRATGITEAEWARSWPLVEKYWRVDGGSLVNDTQLEIYAEAQARSSRATAAAKRANEVRWHIRPDIRPDIPSPIRSESPLSLSLSLSPSLDPSLSPSLKKDTDPAAPSAPQEEPAPKNGAGVSATMLSRFLRFWNAYPAKKGKAKAQAAWTRLKPSEALTDTIVAAVVEQRSWPEWLKEHGRYVPNPATWLNQGRWDDEPSRTGGQASLLSDIGLQNRISGAIAIKRIMEES